MLTKCAFSSLTIEDLSRFEEAPLAASTRKEYARDLQRFETFAGTNPVTFQTVAGFILFLHRGGLSLGTIERNLASLSRTFPDAVRHRVTSNVMKSLRRELGGAKRRVRPLCIETIREIVKRLPSDLSGARDRALLLLGFSGAFRRSEIVSLDVADLAFEERGLVITLRRSKTDQFAHGYKKAIPFGSSLCPVTAVRTWLERASITEGPIFRSINRHQQIGHGLSGGSVARIIKAHVEAAGEDPSLFSGHSLRAGMATSAASRGRSLQSIMKTTGHKSERIAMSYVRHASLFDDLATSDMF